MNDTTSERGQRLVMWIDGVGGYLVCLGDEVVLGQPNPGGCVDVPILGDVSRDHAMIRRSGEGYLLVPRRATRLHGRELADAAPLSDGAVFELGQGVRLRFRQPHPLSRTARLEFVSGHRTQPSTDGVLLMADTCILGPAATSHVVCSDWRQDLILARQGNGLHCRAPGQLVIDGQTSHCGGSVSHTSHVMGDDFCITLEVVG